MLAVHADLDVCTVAIALDNHATLNQMEKLWRKIAETEQTAKLTELGLVPSSFLKFVQRIVNASVPHEHWTMNEISQQNKKDTEDAAKEEEERIQGALINEDDEEYKQKKMAAEVMKRRSTLFGGAGGSFVLNSHPSEKDNHAKKLEKGNDTDRPDSQATKTTKKTTKFQINDDDGEDENENRKTEPRVKELSEKEKMLVIMQQSTAAALGLSFSQKTPDDSSFISHKKNNNDDDDDDDIFTESVNHNKNKHITAFADSMSYRADDSLGREQQASILLHENRPSNTTTHDNNDSTANKKSSSTTLSGATLRKKRKLLLALTPKLESAVILRAFDELDLQKNGKLPWFRFQSLMSIVANFRRIPPQFCSKSIPIVADCSIPDDIVACALLPQWRLVAVSSGKADGRIYLVDSNSGVTRTSLKDPKQKGLVTGVFLVSLPRMVPRASTSGQTKNLQNNSVMMTPGGKVRKAKNNNNNSRGNSPHSEEDGDDEQNMKDNNGNELEDDDDDDETNGLEEESNNNSVLRKFKHANSFSSGHNNASGGNNNVSAFPQIVTAATDGSVIVWDLNRMGGLDSTRYINVERPVIFLAFDKSTNFFFALLDNGSLVCIEWAVAACNKTHELKIKHARAMLRPIGPHVTPPTCLAVLDALGQFATSGDDSIIALWSSIDMVCICRVVSSGGNFPSTVFDGLGNILFSSNNSQQESKNGILGEEKEKKNPLSGDANELRYSLLSSKFAVKKLTVFPKLNRIFAVHANRNISCWDVGAMLLEGKDSVGILKGGHERTIVHLSADYFGEFLVSVDEASTICVWSARSLLLLERSSAPLTKFDKRALANVAVSCACYDVTARELILFSKMRMRKFSAIPSGLCAPRSDHPFEEVRTPELLGRQLLAKKPILVEVDDASSLVVFVTHWDVGFFSLIDGMLVAHVAAKDIFGGSLGSEGILHAFLSSLPPNRRLATDVAASFLSLSDGAGRTVGAVPASVVEAQTPDLQIACFRKILLNTSAPVKVKLEPSYPLPSFRKKKISLATSSNHNQDDNNNKTKSLLTKFKALSSNNLHREIKLEMEQQRRQRDEASKKDRALVIPSLFGVFLFAFRGCVLALSHSCIVTCVVASGSSSSSPVSEIKRKEKKGKMNEHEENQQRKMGVRFSTGSVDDDDDDESVDEKNASSDDEKNIKVEEIDDDEDDDDELVASSLIIEPVAFHSFQHGSSAFKTQQKHQHEAKPRGLLHLFNDSPNRFMSLCFAGISEVAVLQYNKNSATPNSTDLVVKEARIDPSKGFPVSSIASESHNLLLVCVGNDRLMGFAMTRELCAIFEIHSLSKLRMVLAPPILLHQHDQAPTQNVNNKKLISCWKASIINTASLGKHLVLVPEYDEYEMMAVLTRPNNNNSNNNSHVSFSASSLFEKLPEKQTASAAATAAEAADSLVLPVSWFVDSFITTRKLELNAMKGIHVRDPIIAGTCLVFKPSLADHFAGVSFQENLHLPKREPYIFPATIGESGPPCVVKIFPNFESHIATVDQYHRMSQRAKRCCVRILYSWDSSGDALAAKRDSRLPLELDPMLNQSHIGNNNNNNNNAAAANSAFSLSFGSMNKSKQKPGFAGNPDPAPIRGLVAELGRPRLRDLLHAPTVDRVHSLLSVVDTIAELTASGYTCLDFSLNSIVQTSDGRWKLSALHAIRRVPAYGSVDFASIGNEASVMYSWYCDPEFCDGFVKRRGNPVKYPSALWAVGCLAFELATRQNVVQLETPQSGYFELNDIMEGLSRVIPAVVREAITSGKRRILETLPPKEQGFAVLMLDFASICLLPAATQFANFAFVSKQLRQMIEAASSEHHRDEVIKRTDREGAIDEASSKATKLTELVLANAGFTTTTAVNLHKTKKTTDDDDDENDDQGEQEHVPFGDDRAIPQKTKSIISSATTTTTTRPPSSSRKRAAFFADDANENNNNSIFTADDPNQNLIIKFNATEDVPWIHPEFSKNFLPPSCSHLYAVRAGASVIVAFADNSSNLIISSSNNAVQDISNDAAALNFLIQTSSKTMMGGTNNETAFSASCIASYGSFNLANNNTGTNKGNANANSSFTRKQIEYQTEMQKRRLLLKRGCMVLLTIDIKDGATQSDRTSRLGPEHFVHNGTAPPPLFGLQFTARQEAEYSLHYSGVNGSRNFIVKTRATPPPEQVSFILGSGNNINNNNHIRKRNKVSPQSSSAADQHQELLDSMPFITTNHNNNHLIKWRLPSKCVGASCRMTMSAPVHSRVVWMAREFGSVSNAPIPFADAYSTALLPPDIAALATSISPVAEQNYTKLQHASLERAVVGNWESFTTGEILTFFKAGVVTLPGGIQLDEKQATAMNERAKMEQWERNLARRAPFFAAASEAVSANKASGESRSVARMGKALEITARSRRGLLDSLALAHQGNVRRLERNKKRSQKAMLDLQMLDE